MSLFCCFPQISAIGISNCVLIEPCCAESPDSFLVKSMINNGLISIRRIGIDAFSLIVIEIQFLVVILSRDHWGVTNSCAFFGFKLLESFPIIVFYKTDIIYIFKKSRVILNALMESLERIIEIWRINKSTDNGIHAEVEASIHLLIIVLHFVKIDS